MWVYCQGENSLGGSPAARAPLFDARPSAGAAAAAAPKQADDDDEIARQVRRSRGQRRLHSSACSL